MNKILLIKADLPELTGTNTPVRRDSFVICFAYSTARFSGFPFEACIDKPCGTRHLFAPLRQPIPKEERCAGQIVHVEISFGNEKTDARANISSTSDCTSLIPTLWVCLEISLSQDAKGIITSRPYLLSDEQTPPVSFLKEHVTSMVVAL